MSEDKREPVVSPVVGLDQVIHEPSRLLIVTVLYVVDEADFVYLLRQTGLTAGNLGAHLTKLAAAGYVEIAKSFIGRRPNTMSRLTVNGREAFDRYREHMSNLLKTAGEQTATKAHGGKT